MQPEPKIKASQITPSLKPLGNPSLPLLSFRWLATVFGVAWLAAIQLETLPLS